MPKYKGVIHAEINVETSDEETAEDYVARWLDDNFDQIGITIHEIPSHQGKKIIGYDCTACDRDIIPMYDAGKMMCPWCRGIDYVKTIYEE